MRYAILTAASLALLSTGAMAQNNTPYPQNQASRAYAPVAAPTSPAGTTFPQGVIQPQDRNASTISPEERLFLMQGDRGLGNG